MAVDVGVVHGAVARQVAKAQRPRGARRRADAHVPLAQRVVVLARAHAERRLAVQVLVAKSARARWCTHGLVCRISIVSLLHPCAHLVQQRLHDLRLHAERQRQRLRPIAARQVVSRDGLVAQPTDMSEAIDVSEHTAVPTPRRGRSRRTSGVSICIMAGLAAKNSINVDGVSAKSNCTRVPEPWRTPRRDATAGEYERHLPKELPWAFSYRTRSDTLTSTGALACPPPTTRKQSG